MKNQFDKIIIMSPPKGNNMVYERWTDAIKKRSNYIPIDVHWNKVWEINEKWNCIELKQC